MELETQRDLSQKPPISPSENKDTGIETLVDASDQTKSTITEQKHNTDDNKTKNEKSGATNLETPEENPPKMQIETTDQQTKNETMDCRATSEMENREPSSNSLVGTQNETPDCKTADVESLRKKDTPDCKTTDIETVQKKETPDCKTTDIEMQRTPEQKAASTLRETGAKSTLGSKNRTKPPTNDLRKLTNEEVRLVRPTKNQTLDHAFAGMEIQDASFLDDLDGRQACDRCGKSRKYFCYTCYVPLPSIAQRIPQLKLPFKIDVIKHPKEIDGKSTAVHAAIIAPQDVNIYTYPDVPDYNLQEKVVLIFPDKSACRVSDLPTVFPGSTSGPDSKRPRQDLPFSKVVFIDCTWNQTRKIYNDERLRGLQCLELDDRDTLFWRYQRGKPNTYLATIEAMYYFLVDVHSKVMGQEYSGQYDNLLFFFKFMFDKIHSLYDVNCLRAYKDC